VIHLSETNTIQTHIATMAALIADLTLLNELYEEIERNPLLLEARKTLIQQCYEVVWIDTARDALGELKVFDPSALVNDSWAKTFLESLANLSAVEEEPRIKTLLEPPTKKAPLSQAKKAIPKPPTSPADLEAQKLELVREYEELRLRAKKLRHESLLLQNLATASAKNDGSRKAPISKIVDQDLQALINGCVHSLLMGRQPISVLSATRKIEQEPHKAVEIAFSDLKNVVRRLRFTSGDDDAVREALHKRTQTISTALTEAMKKHASTTFMHIEHELLHRKYNCNETMYGDPVADIPGARFLATEDGYP
jgi:hypothetical protein